jgi:putative transposase
MKKEKRRYKKLSTSEKLRILKEGSEHGVKVTCERYSIYPATYYNWRKNIHKLTSNQLDSPNLKELTKENIALKEEVQHYKNMLAEEQLKSRLKDELLKKKYAKLS